MQEQNYSIWDYKKITTGSELTIYYNDFLVYVVIEINNRNFPTNSGWTQVGTMSISQENLRPIKQIISSSNYVNLDFSINSRGIIGYHNKSNTSLTNQSPVVMFVYPRKDGLP